MADFEKVYSISFNIRGAERGIRKLNDGLEKVERKGKRAAKKISKSFSMAGKKMESFGKSMSKYVTAPLLAAGAASAKFALNLNKSMANVSTLLSGSVDQVKQLKGGIQDLAVETGKSTTDLADGLYQVVSALGESSDNMGQLKIAARASVAGLSETGAAINMLSAVTKGYGDVSEDSMKKVSDLAFKTVKLGVTTFPELAESMGKVVPLAAAMNTRQEELFGTMATLTGVTGDTSEVVTQLASVYSAFLKPTKKMTEAANALGFESAATMMKTLGFRESLIALNEAAGGSEDALAKMLKRKEALVGALALLGGQSDTYVKKLAEMEDAVGSTDEAYRKQTEGINAQGHAWERTKQRFVVVAQRLGDKLIPAIEKLAKKLEPWLKKLEDIDDETMEMIVNIGAMAAAVGPLIMLFGKMNLAMAAVSGGLGSMTTGMRGGVAAAGSLGGKIGGLVGKLGLLGQALGAGVLVGTAIHEGIVAPMAEKQHRQKRRRQSAQEIAELRLKYSASESMLEESIKSLSPIQQRQRESIGRMVNRLPETPSERDLNDTSLAAPYLKTRYLKHQLQKKLQQQRAEAFQREQGLQFETSLRPSQQQQTTVNAPTTININASQLSAEQVGREVSRQMKKRDNNVQRMSQKLAAAEI